MKNILCCICQDSNQQSYKVLFNMSPSSLHNTLKSASKANYSFYRFLGGILSNTFLREHLNASPESWDEAQASGSKMGQTKKSIGFKSGDEGGQTSLLHK